MRRVFIFAGLAMGAISAAFTVYFGTRPPVAIEQLREAIVRQDSSAMNRLIDFPSFRESIKVKLREDLASSAANSGNPMAILGSLLAETFLEPLVNIFVSPSGIAAIVAGHKMRDMSKGPPPPTDRQVFDSSLQFTGAWESPSRYSVTVNDRGTKTVVLVMHRYSLFEWKLAELR